jgi:quinol monooxygenase YgiN
MAAMAVLVHAEIHGLAGRAADLRELLREHADRLAGAAGALAAHPYEPIAGEPGEFVLDVLWHDERVLREHYATEEYADYARRIGELLARPSDVTVHTIASSYQPVGDLSMDPVRQD